MSVALVTGGGRGIGANIARALAKDGWEVVVTARSLDEIEAVAAEIGGRALELDVAAEQAVEHVFEEVGDIDLLVANAGRAPATRVQSWEQPVADWWQTFEVNVLGSTSAAAP